MIYSKYYKMLSEFFEEDFKKFTDFAGICSTSPDSSNYDICNNYPNWDTNDFLESVKYDEIELENHPAFFTCVSPVHLVPSNNTTAAADTISSNIQDLSCSIPWEACFPNYNLNDLSDDFINDFTKTDININNTFFFDQTINSALYKTHNSSDYELNTKVDTIAPVRSCFQKPYHLDFDHCYSAPPPKPEENEEKNMTYWDSSPCSPDSSETSSEEVDVVTVPEELMPTVPKVEIARKIPRKRGRKKKAQSSLSVRSLKAAMKNSRITTIRRAYRRKVSNSVETSPSSSVPSSTQSSRCNSDVEDAGKRANHNSSERKRREILRTALQNLRLCVPNTQLNAKAPKVHILNSATDFINELVNDERDLRYLKKLEDQRRRQKEAQLKSLISYFKKRC